MVGKAAGRVGEAMTVDSEIPVVFGGKCEVIVGMGCLTAVESGVSVSGADLSVGRVSCSGVVIGTGGTAKLRFRLQVANSRTARIIIMR